jgi:hypothetical protein
MGIIGVLVAFFIAIITCVLVVLKILGIVDYDWEWIFSPAWVSAIFAIIWVFECIVASFVIKAIRLVLNSSD